MKRIFFHALAWLPLLVFMPAIIFMFFTNLPQMVYTHSIRNIYFDCLEFVPDDYVYKAKPGPCKFQNIEFDTVLNHNADGFRNPDRLQNYDVAVLGDSQAHGWGVQDDQTFSHLLGSTYHHRTVNLAIGSYATERELEVFRQYDINAKYVVIQYCDNDSGENAASITLNKDEFKSQVESFWRSYIARYDAAKAEGYKRAIIDLAVKLRNLDFAFKTSWRRSVEKREMEKEASAFTKILDRNRSILEGKRLIVLESSPWGLNSPRFAETFATELSKLDWLSYKVIDPVKVVDYGDHYFLDGHLNPIGHRKFAAAIAAVIAQWEKRDPRIANN